MCGGTQAQTLFEKHSSLGNCFKRKESRLIIYFFFFIFRFLFFEWEDFFFLFKYKRISFLLFQGGIYSWAVPSLMLNFLKGSCFIKKYSGVPSAEFTCWLIHGVRLKYNEMNDTNCSKIVLYFTLLDWTNFCLWREKN